MTKPDNRPDRRSPNKGGKNDKQKEPMGWRGTGRSLIFWLTLFLVVFISYTYYTSLNQEQVEITYTEFMEQVDGGNLAEATFTEREVEGVLKEPRTFSSASSNKEFF